MDSETKILRNYSFQRVTGRWGRGNRRNVKLFRENYSVKNLPYLGFTGQNEDTIGQNNYTAPALYDFLYREHSPNAGRWISPDPAD